MRPITYLGNRSTAFVAYTGSIVGLLVETVRSVFTWGSPRRWQWVSIQMLQIGVRSLAVSGVILFMIGMVIAFQTAYQMQRVGAEMLIPGLIAVSMTRELGPMMTALVVAGRAGAAMTAEIGTMTVTDQVAAMQLI